MRRLRGHWRWGVAVLLISALVSLPTLIRIRPVHVQAIAPAALLIRIRASGDVPWSGYGESRGGVALPDVSGLEAVTELLGQTTRYRVWWRGATQHRVDSLSLTGESDVTQDSTGTWIWSSDDNRSTRIVGIPPVHLLRADDLVAPSLGRRLAGTKAMTARSIAPRRLAGRSLPGVELIPDDPASTTVTAIDMWAQPDTGLVLRVDVLARHQRVPVMSSLLLDLNGATPSLADASYRPEVGTIDDNGLDLASAVNAFSPLQLPGDLAGMPREGLITGEKGIGTYGSGPGQVLVVPVERRFSRPLIRSFEALNGSFTTALLNGLLVDDGQHRQYLLVGSVPASVLQAMGNALLASPPPSS